MRLLAFPGDFRQTRRIFGVNLGCLAISPRNQLCPYDVFKASGGMSGLGYLGFH